MPISIECPSCKSKIRVPDSAAGKKGKCPKCSHAIVVPSVKTPDPLPVPKPPVQQSRQAVWFVVGGVAAAAVCGLAIIAGAAVLIVSNIGPAKTKEEQKQALQKVKEEGEQKTDKGKQKTDKAPAAEDIEKLIAEGEQAIAKRETKQATYLLQKYLASPVGVQKDRAKRLLEEIEMAGSDEKALVFLRTVPSEELERLAGKQPFQFGGPGTPVADAEVRRITNQTLQTIYRATLERNCAKELASSHRAEEQKRIQLDSLKPTIDIRFALEKQIQDDWTRLKLRDPAAVDVVRRLRVLKFDCDGVKRLIDDHYPFASTFWDNYIQMLDCKLRLWEHHTKGNGKPTIQSSLEKALVLATEIQQNEYKKLTDAKWRANPMADSIAGQKMRLFLDVQVQLAKENAGAANLAQEKQNDKKARLEKSKKAEAMYAEYFKMNSSALRAVHNTLGSSIIIHIKKAYLTNKLNKDISFQFMEEIAVFERPECWRVARYLATEIAGDWLLSDESEVTLREAWEAYEKLGTRPPQGRPGGIRQFEFEVLQTGKARVVDVAPGRSMIDARQIIQGRYPKAFSIQCQSEVQ